MISLILRRMWKTFSNCKLRQITCTKCSCTGPLLAVNTVGLRREMDLTAGHWVGTRMVWSSPAAWHCFTSGLKSTAGEGGRGRCHRLWLVLVRRAEAAHCRSSCCRIFPHSSGSGAAEGSQKRATLQIYCCLWVRISGCKSIIWEQTFRLEMENSFSHSLQWLASLSFNQTWPPWNTVHLCFTYWCKYLNQAPSYGWRGFTSCLRLTLPEELYWLL